MKNEINKYVYLTSVHMLNYVQLHVYKKKHSKLWTQRISATFNNNPM